MPRSNARDVCRFASSQPSRQRQPLTLHVEQLEDRTVPALFAPQLDVSSLDGSTGFALNGITDYDNAGVSVRQAGDVNGDGFGDLIVGANYEGNYRGQAYVIFGHSGGFLASLALSSLDGTNGFTLNGIADYDQAGRAVSGAGDVNGDGFDDLLVGARYASGGGIARGEAYVIFGHSGAFAASLDLSSLDGSNGFALHGVEDLGNAGYAVSGAGDVNGDSFADLLVGAPNVALGGGNRGQAYVVFGHSGAFADTIGLSSLDGSTGFALNGIANDDQAALSVSGAGDVNGDGFDDVIVGSLTAAGGGNRRGQAYVVFGHSGSFTASLDLSDLNGVSGFALNGVADYDNAGFVSGAGDINGDGFDDLLVGASYADVGGNNRGQAYVVFGHGGSFSASLNLSTLNGSTGFALNGIADYDYAGHDVSGAGDVNGDGFDDLLVAAPYATVGATHGQAYVVFGHGGAFAASLELSDLNGSNGLTVSGIDNSNASMTSVSAGLAVSGAGDVNGDGIDDLIVGAPYADAGGSDRGQSYVIFGRCQLIAAGSDKGGAPLVNVFKVNGQLRDDFLAYDLLFSGGVRVAVGDLTGDGQPDIVTAPGAGIATQIKVFDGRTGLPVGTPFSPFGASFTRGAFVAVGNVDPGHAGNEIVVSPGKGKKKVVVTDLSGVTLSSFFAFGKKYKGGVRVATGDVSGGPADEIIAVRQTSSSLVRVFNNTGTKLAQFTAFSTAGAFVAVGNLDGTGQAEIVVGAGKNAQVSLFTGAGAPIRTFTAIAGYTGSVRVATVERFGQTLIVTAPGGGTAPTVRLFDELGTPPPILSQFPAFSLPFVGGVFVGGG